MGYNPYSGKEQPCWTCQWYDGMAGQGTCAQCAHPRGSKLRATPEMGCCSWTREPGSDDEPLTKELMQATWRHLRWPEPALRDGSRALGLPMLHQL